MPSSLKLLLKPVQLPSIPSALTIAGSDSGGGAGVQADLKTFAALRVHGTCAITCITAQNPKRVTGIQAVNARMVRKQIEAVFEELPPDAVKTGMLFNSEIIRVIAEFFEQGKRPPLVVDPVMVATSGAVLLKTSAIRLLKNRLLPLAALVTPNLDEAEILVGRKLRSVDDLQMTARKIYDEYGCAALVNGGHLKLKNQAVDILFDGKQIFAFRAARIRGVSTHGTGCTYSAAIAAELAKGASVVGSVRRAKVFMTRAIRQSRTVGKHSVLNPFHR